MRTVIRLTALPAASLLATGSFTAAHAADSPSPVLQDLGGPGRWTAERMRQAEAHPRDLPERGTARADGPIAKAVVAKGHHRAPLEQIGRLYVQSADGRFATCTGTVVNSAYPGESAGNGSVVLTAAHCLRDPQDGWYARYLAFAPDRDKGSTPYGLWGGYRTLMWSSWARDRDFAFDYAFVAMAKRPSGTIQKATGGQSIRFGTGHPRMWLRLYGYAGEHYPGDQPYPDNGAVLRMCKGRTTPWASGGHKFLKLPCDLSHGASGGPLITGLSKSGYGRIVGVVSFSRKGVAAVYSPLLDKWARSLFFKIRTVSVPVRQDPPDPAVRAPVTAPGR